MPTYRITGLKAAIDGLQCLKEWKVNVAGVDTVSACSASDGAVLRTAGNADWGGVAVGYGLPTKYPNELFTFTGADRAGNGWQSAASGAIVSAIHIFCPIRAGRHLYYHLYFSGNGSLSSGAYAASDASTPAPVNCKGLSTSIGSGVEGWDLKIEGNCTNPTYAAYTAGWPGRDPGNIDAELSWVQTTTGDAPAPTINSIGAVTLSGGTTGNWVLNWMQVLSIAQDTPIEGDPPGQAEYIRLRCKSKFTGYNAGAKGSILKPGGAVYWP